MSMSNVYPWQAEAWQSLWRRRQRGRLPHALLICGPGGTGERAFAEAFLQALLCTGTSEAAACGTCPACHEYAAGTHPDAMRVEPEESGKAIGIDRIRDLVGRLGLTGGGRAKVALIDPAESMTTQAGNSLLKPLEEPPGDTVLLLVSARPGRLPATVRSRCQRVAFGLPERTTALKWLQTQGDHAEPERLLDRAGGAPLRALELAQASVDEKALIKALARALRDGHADPEAIAAGAQVPLASSVAVLVVAVQDMIRLRLATDPPLRLPQARTVLERAAVGVDVRALFQYLDALQRSLPGPSSALRADIQWPGLLADAAATRRDNQA